MPIPFDDLTETGRPSSVAWLRFVDEEEGNGIRAALFETSGLGEPLGFCFTHIDRRDPSLSQTAAVNWRQLAILSLSKSLFRSATESPSLILGLADEIPPWVVADALHVGLPFCRVRLGNKGAPQLQWATDKPREGTEAHRILDGIMARDDPFDAFGRAAECLNKVFEYRRVRGIATMNGLHAVVHLCRPLTAQGIFRSGMAERLWALLALRPTAPHQAQESFATLVDSHLEWPGELMPFQQDGVPRIAANEAPAPGRRHGTR